MEKESVRHNNIGSVKIANEVVSIIAGLAATKVAGVAGMSGGIVRGITEKLGRRNLTKGIKVEVGEKEAVIDIFVVIEFGVRIPDIALKIQENVGQVIGSMTGLNVKEVNVHIQGVVFP